MNETTQQWQDAGSGPGHMQTVSVTKAMRADAAYREFLAHTGGCEESCPAGVNCDEAAVLYRRWIDLKTAAV